MKLPLKLNKKNTSGYIGVSFRYGKWVSRISVNKKRMHLGNFDTKEEAANAYLEARNKYYTKEDLLPFDKKLYYKNNQDRIKQYIVDNKEKIRRLNNRNTRDYRKREKIKVIEKYGGCCECCGENKLEFMSIDHIGNTGHKHRKELKGKNIYVWLKLNNYPKDKFRCLCLNCNLSYGMYGYCPHKENKLFFDPSDINYNRKTKQTVVQKYGSKCQCCGEDKIEFITVDHVLGNGNKHRKKICDTMYHWLIKQGFPKDGFRLLCMNCNFSLGKYGYCPHSVLYSSNLKEVI